MEIKEVIVVEGKNDSKRLKSFFKVDTIETGGSHLSQKTINLIKEVATTRGVILLLDPDSPGEKIRQTLNHAIPGLKNAFLLKEDARTSKKVGVEHAEKTIIEAALANLVTYGQNHASISQDEFYRLGLNGQSDSEMKRSCVAKALHIGKCNAKTMYKRLNMLGIDATMLDTILKEAK